MVEFQKEFKKILNLKYEGLALVVKRATKANRVYIPLVVLELLRAFLRVTKLKQQNFHPTRPLIT